MRTLPDENQETITVAAAANLTDAFDEIGKAFHRKIGVHVVYSYGATTQLAQQVEHSAPFDVFAAADTDHIDDLVRRGSIRAERRAVYARVHSPFGFRTASRSESVIWRTLLVRKFDSSPSLRRARRPMEKRRLRQ